MYFLFNAIAVVFFIIERLIGYFDKKLALKKLTKTRSKLAFEKLLYNNGNGISQA